MRLEKLMQKIGITKKRTSDTATDINTSHKDIKTVKAVFSDEFIIGSQTVEAKHILAYITGKAAPMLGSDYYYAYTYNDGYLCFIAAKSDTHLTGKTSVFTTALMNEGRYLYNDGARYFLITNQNGIIDNLIMYSLPEDKEYIELEEGDTYVPSSEKHLIYEWSLKKKNLNIELALAGVLAISMTFYGVTLNEYNHIQDRAETIKSQERMQQNAPKPITTTMDIGAIITELKSKIDPYEGLIDEIRLEKGNLSVALKFTNESYMRMFLGKHGGKLENDKILLSFNNTNNSNPPPGSKGGQEQKGSGDTSKPADTKASSAGTGSPKNGG